MEDCDFLQIHPLSCGTIIAVRPAFAEYCESAQMRVYVFLRLHMLTVESITFRCSYWQMVLSDPSTLKHCQRQQHDFSSAMVQDKLTAAAKALSERYNAHINQLNCTSAHVLALQDTSSPTSKSATDAPSQSPTVKRAHSSGNQAGPKSPKQLTASPDAAFMPQVQMVVCPHHR